MRRGGVSFPPLLRCCEAERCWGLCTGRHHLSDIDQVIGEDAEPDPSLHSLRAPIQTAPQSMPPLEHTDASFASGPPRLRFLEPPALLHRLAFLAARIAVGHRHPLDAHLLQSSLMRLRVVVGDYARAAITFPILIRLSARTPSPPHRFIP